VITALLFYIGWQITQRGWFGGIVALAHCLNMGQLLFEPNLLSETASTFWITLSVAGVVVWLYNSRWRKGAPGVLLGIGVALCASMVWLTRTLFIYLPFWIVFFLILVRIRDDHFPYKQIRLPGSVRLPVFAYILPVIAILAIWVGWIKYRFGDWALTTMTGYHMVQHTGLFFEYVPDEYAGLRDIFLKYRDLQFQAHGSPANAIWDAIPEMQQVSGLSFYDLSRTLQRISTRLILAHPFLYLQNVIQGWWFFWRAPVYWQPEALRWPIFAPLLESAALVSRLSVFALNLAFVIGSPATLIASLRKRYNPPPVLWFIAGSVWIASILQTLADHGDNPRFLVPLQSLVVLWVFFTVSQLIYSWVTGTGWRRLAARAVRSIEP
jgi:hypothetical protein